MWPVTWRIGAVNEAFGTTLPEDEFDTIGGLVAQELGRVPRRAEMVELGGLRFTVMLTRGGAVRWFRVRARAAGRGPGRRRPPRLKPACALRCWRRGRWSRWPSRRSARCRPWPSCTPRCGRCRWPRWRCWCGACTVATPGRAALLGWCYGTAWLCAGTWWLFISMHRYGGLPAPLAGAAVFALSAALSLYLAAACAAYARWRRGGAADVALFAALWLLAELARGLLFTGFPWVAAGYAMVDAPLAALAPWLGVYGIGAVMAALAAGLVMVVQAAAQAARRSAGVRPAALALAAPLGLLLGGRGRAG